MAEPETHDYMFLNACDGSALTGEDTGLGGFDVDGHGLTEEEAKERACELSDRLASVGGFLVGAYKVQEVFCVQRLGGKYVDRVGDPLAVERLPVAYRDQ